MSTKKLWPQNAIVDDETVIPALPRLFWILARGHYEAHQNISAILMAGLAVESGVNEYASAWLHKNLGKGRSEAMRFLENTMDFRKTVELLWFAGAFQKELRDDLHTVYDGRNKYAHIQSLKILGAMGEAEVQKMRPDGVFVRKVKVKDDEVVRRLGVLMKAEEEAWTLLEKTEHSLVRLFKIDESDYWKDLVESEEG